MMRITDLLREETIILDVQSKSKQDVLSELVTQLAEAGSLNDKESFMADILAREEQSTTGIGDGIAIPHAKSAAVKKPAIAFGRSTEGIDFESLDGKPAHVFFMIAASDGANNDHLEALSRLATFLMDDQFREKILAATSKNELLAIVNEKEVEVDGPEEVVEVDAANGREDTCGYSMSNRNCAYIYGCRETL